MLKTTGILLGGLLIGGAPAWAQQASGHDDRKTEDRIQSSFQEDPALRDNRVDVHVENGVATLTGTVDSKSERAKAEQLALANGAAQVKDDLRVGATPEPAVP